jgi:hypothetical protein
MVNPEAATAVVELLMMGVRTPQTCWAVFKRRVISLRNCCIWLVDSFEWLLFFLDIFDTRCIYYQNSSKFLSRNGWYCCSYACLFVLVWVISLKTSAILSIYVIVPFIFHGISSLYKHRFTQAKKLFITFDCLFTDNNNLRHNKTPHCCTVYDYANSK